MKFSLKKPKICYLQIKLLKKTVSDKLKEIRVKRNVTKEIPLQEIQSQQFGSDISS